LFIRDQEGRAGKGLISNTFLRRLFNGKVADNCNTDHVTGKFNSVIAGQAVIVVNETRRDKVDVERMKAFLGSPKILIEAKYQVPYLADNTGLVMSYSNEITGGITLSGTQSDNRYSLFKTTKNIYQTCQRYMLEYEQQDLTLEEVKTWIEGVDENSGQNFGNVKLEKLLGKIVIIVDRSNTSFLECPEFYKFINMTSNSVFMRALHYYDIKYTPDMNELIDFNKQNIETLFSNLSMKIVSYEVTYKIKKN
jgi:hypothetical protein